MEYEKCLVELDEVLNHLESSDYEKIPDELLEAIKQNKDKSYEWRYDVTKSLKEQNLNRNTIAMLSYINSEYLLNEEQKNYMQKIYELNEKNAEEEKNRKYDTNNIFKDRQKNIKDEITKEEMSLVEIKEEKWYKKVINYIKNLFKK